MFGQLKIFKLYKNNYSHFYRYSQADKKLSLIGMISIALVVFSNTIMIWLMGDAINQIQSGISSHLYTLLIIFAIVVIFNQSLRFANGWIINEVCLRFIGRCRNALLSRTLMLSFPVISKMSKGDILARLSNDIDILSQIVVTARLMIVSHVLTLVIYVMMLFWINVTLATISLATIPLYLFHQRYFAPRKQRATRDFLNNNAELLGYEEQSLSNLRGISSNTAEQIVSNNHNRLFNVAKKFAIKERLLLSGFDISFMLINYLVGLMIIVFGVLSIQQGVLTVGTLLSFILYLGYLTVPVHGISELILQCSGNIAAATRVNEIFNIEATTSDNFNAVELIVNDGRIDIEALSFSYLDDKIIFKNLSLHIEAKKTYALVGPSGAGKSSLINLLTRFYDPDQGLIKIDGVNIRDVSLRSLRANIAVVWQDNFHINETIKENLLLANPHATDTQIQTACIAANAWQFISDFPNGLQTRLGCDGITLSGGQYQRLTIAQAFLKDAKIIVFDEASSALDSQSEQKILLSLEEKFFDRTLLIIAHRYSSIQKADHVIYFQTDGTTIIGNHRELYQQLDDYRDAVSWQTSLETE